jgi:hypothetical protein
MKAALAKSHVVGIFLVVSLTGGCSRVLNVMATDEVCKKSVELHLVGVNRFEKERWEIVSMTDYWTPGNQLRKSAAEYTYVIQFGQGPCTRTLAKKDPIRKIWKSRKAEYLFVLADLPGVFTDQPGNADPRRLRLPAANSRCWGVRQRSINVSVEGSNIVPLTIPKSKCK